MRTVPLTSSVRTSFEGGGLWSGKALRLEYPERGRRDLPRTGTSIQAQQEVGVESAHHGEDGNVDHSECLWPLARASAMRLMRSSRAI